MSFITEENFLDYNWENGKVPSILSTDIVNTTNANKQAIALALRTANLHNRLDLVEKWKTILTNEDENNIVNTLTEMQAFLKSVPEGADFIEAMNKKVDKYQYQAQVINKVEATYDNYNETHLKFIDVAHNELQPTFTLNLFNSHDCNLDLRLKNFTNLVLNVNVNMPDGTMIPAGQNIPIQSTAVPVMMNISSWNWQYILTIDFVSNSLTGTRTYIPISEAQGKILKDNYSAILLPVGHILASLDVNVPLNYLPLNGGAYLKTSYAALYNVFLRISPTPRWLVNADTNKFNLPDYRGKFMRMHGGNSGNFAEYQGDTIRNITGSFSEFFGGVNSSGFSGAMASLGFVTGLVGGTSNHYKSRGVSLDASRVVPTSVENRPTNFSAYYYIKYQ